MALHLGNSKALKINLNNAMLKLIVPPLPSITNGVQLISADNYILTDVNGLYLTAKESE